jgi:1-acyl-sn-glycerol-3-phosphate acyltransferase
MIVLRSLLYAALFYPATLLWAVAGLVGGLLGDRYALAVVLSWTQMNHWLVTRLLGIRIRVEGKVPPGPHLIAVKHQSMLETLEMVRITSLPIIVIKQELADLPLFGWMTRRYGVIPVERSAGAKALRAMVVEAKKALATGRAVIIYPEGTRVRVGETPPLRSGFAALYRTLGLPVVPVATDAGVLWGRGLIHRPGTVTLKVGETVPPGLKREEVERRVHAAINALESSAQPGA